MDIYELMGFIIGDGNLYYNSKKRVYRLELVGNVEEDYDYFDKVEKFLLEFTGKTPKKFIRKERKGKSIRIQFNNKKFVEYLVSLGLPVGKKTFGIKLPVSLLKDRKKIISVLKGLFEADGCLYFSKSRKERFSTYPRLENKKFKFRIS